MGITRLGPSGHGTRRAGSFVGKASSMHPVGILTRMMSSGHGTRRIAAGAFDNKGGGAPAASASEFIVTARRRLRR